MREKLVIANWKMHGLSQENSNWVKEISDLGVANLTNTKVIVCAPSVYLTSLKEPLTNINIELGAQNVSDKIIGAYTGEISAPMLKDIGVNWCIVGHSERRTLYGETDEIVAEKALRLVESGIRPIICVGETLEESQAGITREVTLRQLQACLDVMSTSAIGAIAYEPIWAIGTGKTAKAQDAQAVHKILREHLGEDGKRIPIIYGGSVKPTNASLLFAQPDIDGGLIGGAALVASDFFKICELR